MKIKDITKIVLVNGVSERVSREDIWAKLGTINPMIKIISQELLESEKDYGKAPDIVICPEEEIALKVSFQWPKSFVLCLGLEKKNINNVFFSKDISSWKIKDLLNF